MIVQKKIVTPRGILLAGLVTPEVLQFSLPVVLTCGLQDFNFQSFINVFTQSRDKHLYFLFFDGKHQWPDTSLFEYGYTLLSLNPTSIKSDNLKTKVIEWMQMEKWELVYLNLPFLKLVFDSNFIDSIQTILSRKFSFPFFMQSFQVEQQKQQNLMSRIVTGDTAYFKTWLDSASRRENSNISFTERNSLGRIKAYAGIALYSLARNALETKQLQLYAYLRMYELIEPLNTEMMFLHAAYWSEQKKCDKAKIWLQKAYDNGFEDKKRLKQMPEFKFCSSELFGHP